MTTIPTIVSGALFRDESDTYQRLVITPDMIEMGDVIAGLDVRGVSADARHDNGPAWRFDLVSPSGPTPESFTGRLVVQEGARLAVDRVFDPETAPTSVDLSIESTDPEFVLREVFDLVTKTAVIPKMLTWKDIDGYPTVQFTGPRKDLVTVLKRYSPGGWESLLLELQPLHETLAQVQELKYNLVPWQRERVETLLGSHSSKRWAPTRLLLTSEDKPRKTIFNQDVRDGWALNLPGVPDATRYVGRELMAALVEQYSDRLDLPEGFKP